MDELVLTRGQIVAARGEAAPSALLAAQSTEAEVVHLRAVDHSESAAERGARAARSS